uniref:J domain-containing protein required for chloroplast accumulation response 1 n=1 Tax=Ananas comosus var. bracteatus TaxID=296719 RepID=A0A6V7NVM4_ANACO|nr:unnamed protein product [Ananas comosus var. bracteatus]
MAKLSGYGHRDSHGTPPEAPGRSPDVDFGDVFGGPPRRRSSAVYDRALRSRADSLDSWARPREEAASGGGFLQRHIPGSESSGCSTPKRFDRDVFSSSPGSRVLSPNRPMLNRYEPLVGGSSLPAQISLSMKLAKGIDNPTFGSPTPRFPYKNEDAACDTYSLPSSPNPSISSFQARTIPLSRLCSHSGDTSDPINASSLLESRSQRNSGSLESYVRNGKWTTGFPEVVIQGIDLLANDKISIVTGAPKSQMEDADYKLGNDHSMEREDVDPKIFKDVLPAESRRKSLQSYINVESGSESTSSQVLDPEGFSAGGTIKDDSKTSQEACKQDASVEGPNPGTQDASVEVTNPGTQDSEALLDDRMVSGKVKGKVKEFIKIFNYEGSPKRKGSFETQDHRSRGNAKSKNRAKAKVSSSVNEPNEVKVTQINNEDAFRVTTSLADEVLEKTKEQISNFNSDIHMINDSSSERNETFKACAESTYETLDSSVGYTEETQFEDIEGCLVEQLSEDHNEPQPKDTYQDQIKISDAKIREWSKGKKRISGPCYQLSNMFFGPRVGGSLFHLSI